MKMLLVTVLTILTIQTSKAELVLVQGAHFTAESFGTLLASSPYKGARAQSITKSRDPKTTTIHDYALEVCQNLKPDSILLGHSQGGAVINEAFGICPQKIKALIYLAATIPFPGEKPFDLFRPQDDEYYFKAIQEDAEGWLRIKDETAFLEAFAPEASLVQGQKILMLATSEPVGTSQSVIQYDLEAFQKIPKLVILTLNDRVITPATQTIYAERLEHVKTAQIPTAHLPMVLSPQKVWVQVRKFLSCLKDLQRE